MSDQTVKFYPAKRLFSEILTQDIRLEPALLDLIDNSVDAYTRNDIKDKREIKINISKEQICITDTCGGIDREMLLERVFRFGMQSVESNKQTIGYYGIGLKRALFKLGNDVIFSTDDGKNFSQLKLNVKKWLEDEKIWELPLEKADKSKLKKNEKGYTRIEINNLNTSISESFTTIFLNNFRLKLSRYYTFFMGDKIEFYLNDELVEPYNLDVTFSKEMKPIRVKKQIEKLRLDITTWIEPKPDARETQVRGKRGFNVFMNNRLILANDDTKDTGWTGDKDLLPKYHPIYNRFRGIVRLYAEDVGSLPINTTKTNFNFEHKYYYEIINLLVEFARPFVDYLSRIYDEEKEELDQREEEILSNKKDHDSDSIEILGVDEVVESTEKPSPPPKKIKMARICFSKPLSQVEEMKDFFECSSRTKLGEYLFDYVRDAEGFSDDD